MPRSLSSDKKQMRLEAHEQLEKQGFKRSPVSLDDLGDLGLGLEVQLLFCTEVFSVSLLRYL